MLGSDSNETVLEVEGMTCGSCVRHVGEALRGVGGVCEVDVDLRARTAVVRHAPEATADALVDALREAGYPSRLA